jgi:hypothetical protein
MRCPYCHDEVGDLEAHLRDDPPGAGFHFTPERGPDHPSHELRALGLCPECGAELAYPGRQCMACGWTEPKED